MTIPLMDSGFKLESGLGPAHGKIRVRLFHGSTKAQNQLTNSTSVMWLQAVSSQASVCSFAGSLEVHKILYELVS